MHRRISTNALKCAHRAQRGDRAKAHLGRPVCGHSIDDVLLRAVADRDEASDSKLMRIRRAMSYTVNYTLKNYSLFYQAILSYSNLFLETISYKSGETCVVVVDVTYPNEVLLPP